MYVLSIFRELYEYIKYMKMSEMDTEDEDGVFSFVDMSSQPEDLPHPLSAGQIPSKSLPTHSAPPEFIGIFLKRFSP